MEHRIRKISVQRDDQKTVVFVVTDLERRIYENPTAKSLTRIQNLNNRDFGNEYTITMWLCQEYIAFSIWYKTDWEKEIELEAKMREID